MIKQLLAILLILSLIACKKVAYNGVIIEKHYTPSSSGVGLSQNASLVTTFENEKYILFIKYDKGIETKTVYQNEYFNKKVGDTINFTKFE